MKNNNAIRMQFPFEFTADGIKNLSLESVVDFMRDTIKREVTEEQWKLANNNLEIVLHHVPETGGVKGYTIADVIIFPE